MDGVNDQRTLDTQSRSVSTIDSFNFSVDDSVGSIAETSSSIIAEGASKESVISHLFQNFLFKSFLSEVFEDPGHEVAL